MDNNNLTTPMLWDRAYEKPPKMRLPSSWNVTSLNTKRLLKPYIKPGMKVLEIGCAPGKILAYCAAKYKAQVAGIDYSKPGVRYATQLFETLGLQADLRCENIFEHSFPYHTFDVVYSLGMVEHFADPKPIVEIHTQLLKIGGVALMVIPNYGGPYGFLQRHFNPENLTLHNMDIMSSASLRKIVLGNSHYKVRAWPAGNLSPWLISFHEKWPGFVACVTTLFFNILGVIQTFNVGFLCPMLVLEITFLSDETELSK